MRAEIAFILDIKNHFIHVFVFNVSSLKNTTLLSIFQIIHNTFKVSTLSLGWETQHVIPTTDTSNEDVKRLKSSRIAW